MPVLEGRRNLGSGRASAKKHGEEKEKEEKA
jgi:hypothetical protein